MPKTHLSVKIRLDPTSQQAAQLAGFAAACRSVWNVALEQRETIWQRHRKGVSFAMQCREVKDLRADNEFIAKAPCNALHATLRDLDMAYRNWWSGRSGPPNWKSAKRSTPTFRVKPEDVRLMESGRHIRVPKVGVIRAAISRRLPGRLLRASFSRHGDRWYISFACEVEAPNPPPHTGPAVGIDVGIANTVALSSGEFLSMAVPGKRDWRKLARLQRQASRRTPGSRGYRNARRAEALWYEHHGNIRRDFVAKSAHDLTRRFGLIAIEDLAMKRMTRGAHGRGRSAKAGLNRSLLLRAFRALRTRLEQKAIWTGTQVVAVDPRYTSQTCSECGHVASGNRESQAVFRCMACGFELHADVNAALNILNRAGQARIDAGGVGGLVRPTVNPEPYATSTEASHVC